MPGVDNEDLGTHCFQYYRPEFRGRVKSGSSIVYVPTPPYKSPSSKKSTHAGFTCSVGEIGFGSGSSREDAVRALLGAGIQAVIAKSFAFICECTDPPLMRCSMHHIC